MIYNNDEKRLMISSVLFLIFDYIWYFKSLSVFLFCFFSHSITSIVIIVTILLPWTFVKTRTKSRKESSSAARPLHFCTWKSLSIFIKIKLYIIIVFYISPGKRKLRDLKWWWHCYVVKVTDSVTCIWLSMLFWNKSRIFVHKSHGKLWTVWPSSLSAPRGPQNR